MRSTTDNSITDGSGNAQIGHNTGEINVGLTFEEHQQALNEALKAKTDDLERAHGAEKDLIRREADELRGRLADVEKDYHERLEELQELKAELAKYQNRFEQEKFDAANAALDRDDSSLAESLFKELLESAQARRKDADREEASLHYRLGKIAEDAVRWHEAYAHYRRAAELSDELDHLKAHARLCWRLAKSEAEQVHGVLRDRVRETDGPDSAAYAVQLNNLGEVVKAQGRYEEAERLYRQALAIDRATIGAGHPEYANHLNNLAGVVEAQGRYAEAERLYRQALEIDGATIGEGHPAYAIRLNNLAVVVQAQRRHNEAEALYREALEIGRATIGEEHPAYATRLNNLGEVVKAQGRHDEAEGLYRQALEIDRATRGEAHPDYAIALANLGRLMGQTGRVAEGRDVLEQALATFRAALPAGHPHIAETERRLAALPGSED